jgi:hypothetical protein
MLSPDRAAAQIPRIMASLATDMNAALHLQAGAQAQPCPQLPAHSGDIVWNNTILRGDYFRRAHVEYFAAPDRFAVLHVCIFPHTHDPASILGFDMVAGRDVATGIFLDYSFPGAASPSPDLQAALGAHARPDFLHHRAKPVWGDVFSDSMLAIRPQNTVELQRAIEIANHAVIYYLDSLSESRPVDAAAAQAAQMQYVLAQRRNEHTLRMLARFTGVDAARAFIDTVLFPLPPLHDAHHGACELVACDLPS